MSVRVREILSAAAVPAGSVTGIYVLGPAMDAYGVSRWWALLLCVPLVGLVAWVAIRARLRLERGRKRMDEWRRARGRR